MCVNHPSEHKHCASAKFVVSRSWRVGFGDAAVGVSVGVVVCGRIVLTGATMHANLSLENHICRGPGAGRPSQVEDKSDGSRLDEVAKAS